MGRQVDREYLNKLVDALNQEVHPLVWGMFSIVDDGYTWCNHLQPDGAPKKIISVEYSTRAKDRVFVETAGRPSIEKFDKRFPTGGSSCPLFNCSFSDSRPIRQCAREIVRKVLTPWAEAWDEAMKKIQEEVDTYENFVKTRREFCKFLEIKFPGDSEESGKIYTWPKEDTELISSVDAWVQYSGKIDLNFRSVPLEIAKELMKVMYKRIPKSDWS